MIRPVKPADVQAICDIYNYYIENTFITFEEQKVTAEQMQERIDNVLQKFGWFVYEKEGEVIGYCYATGWRARSAYRFSVETTVYLKNGFEGNGVGTALYRHLIEDLIRKDIHSFIGGISLPNDSSVALHEKMGFQKIAHFREVGQKFNKWIDVGYWQLVL
ncbi:arsinothricin resistance N-acetyltransferase ArsN1 family B [Carboxylicivirga linearis]|uniref:N-acetyltransferase n=1 Tax=Carboxylicivirga linearis TaxID=1628157 RepID=A0ABS5JUK6_9BACT|nr:arsinothricin resistance N-acetyltransferase ArsN1 family B [Carboxylicivirga linearis]MBS2098503.1 N-acetyltransferase [Carboxylicivirga linearis]